MTNNLRRSTRRALIGTAIATIVASFGSTAALAQQKEPVKIGLVSSQSGTYTQQGAEVIRGVQFAIEQANAAGGVDGRKIEVSMADDEGTPDAGRRVAEKLARDGYNLLIGAIPSSVSLAIAQNLQRWDAAYFIVASKSNKLTGDSCKPRSIRTSHSDAMDIAMIQEWAKTFPEKHFAILAADYVWGRDSGESFTKAVTGQGKDVVLQLYPPVGTKDFAPYIAQLKASNAQAIWVAEIGRDMIAFVKQAQEFGLITQKRLIGHALIMNFVIDATGNALAGVQGNTSYSADIDTPENKKFVAAWRAKFHRVPTDNEAQAYNGAEVIFQGVIKAKSVKPAEVTAALRGATLDTIYGNVNLRAADNQLLLPNYVARVKPVDGVLAPVVEQRYPPSITPPASPDCKM